MNLDQSPETPHAVLDATGLHCPQPLLKAKKALQALQAGQVLQVNCTDPASVEDFKAFAKQTGHILLAHHQEQGIYYFWIRHAG